VHGKNKNYIQNFGLKTRREKQSGKSRSRWEDNIGMDLGKQFVKLWTQCIWFRRGTVGWILWTR